MTTRPAARSVPSSSSSAGLNASVPQDSPAVPGTASEPAGKLFLSALPDLGDAAVGDLTLNEERKIGVEVTQELYDSFDRVRDLELTGYLNQLGYRLVANSNDSQIPFRFFLIDSPLINAWAAPGGVIAINQGLMLTTEHETELAAVIAHEIGHVTQHHYARMVSAQKGSTWLTLGSIALAILAAAKSPDPGAVIAPITANAGFQSARELAFSRDYEREADRVGIQTLIRARLDPYAMPDFFKRLQQATQDSGAYAFLRTHPVSVERISDTQARLQQIPRHELPDSLTYLLVREKIRAAQWEEQALSRYAGQIAAWGKAEKKRYREGSRGENLRVEGVTRYGYAQALYATKRYADAAAQITRARTLLGDDAHPMLATLAARIAAEQGKPKEADELIRQARERFPNAPALSTVEVELALRRNAPGEAAVLAQSALSRWRTVEESDTRDALEAIYPLLAQAYVTQGLEGKGHIAWGEFYIQRGQWRAALEQLQLAQRFDPEDFYQQSSLDARIKEVRARMQAAAPASAKKP